MLILLFLLIESILLQKIYKILVIIAYIEEEYDKTSMAPPSDWASEGFLLFPPSWAALDRPPECP